LTVFAPNSGTEAWHRFASYRSKKEAARERRASGPFVHLPSPQLRSPLTSGQHERPGDAPPGRGSPQHLAHPFEDIGQDPFPCGPEDLRGRSSRPRSPVARWTKPSPIHKRSGTWFDPGVCFDTLAKLPTHLVEREHRERVDRERIGDRVRDAVSRTILVYRPCHPFHLLIRLHSPDRSLLPGPALSPSRGPVRPADIVIGPQGVVEFAALVASPAEPWEGFEPVGHPVRLDVVIHFPWHREAQRFAGERIFFDQRQLTA